MKMKKITITIAVAIMATNFSPLWAQDAADHERMTMEQPVGSASMDHSAMSDSMGNTDEESGVSGTRDPHAYSDGYTFDSLTRPVEADEMNFGMLLVDRFESIRASDNTSLTYDLQGWYGRDYNRLVLKAEGDVDAGELEDARTELLWSHAIAPFWDIQLGARQDSGSLPDRGWLGFGIQGLAPYWFELDVAVYAGDKGRTTLRLDGEYDLLLTQRLILQPRLEADFYGKEDAGRAQGSGLSDLAASVRLRYEIRREIAPYVGVEWSGKFGGTADYARAAGLDTKDTRAVAGVRFWF